MVNFDVGKDYLLFFISTELHSDPIKLRNEIMKVLDEEEKQKVILNLKNVDLIYSEGIGAIIFIYKMLHAKGIELSIIRPQKKSEIIDYALELFSVAVQIYDNEFDAIDQ